jgi:nucleoside-diphosphate-sugar epimerase
VIVGKGMVAGALKDISGWEEDILFSSGVSNSGEFESSPFQKETDLVKSFINNLSAGSSFVYFSTTSIFDSSKSSNPYIIHKLSIEKMLRESNIDFLIVRLPNLVGFSNNPHTLTNYFADSIRKERPITLKSGAIRHLIDVADLSNILNDIKRMFGKKKLTVNVDTDKPLSAGKILEFLEETLNKKAIIQIVPENNNGIQKETVNADGAIDFLWKTEENYHKELFKKYYSN